MKRFRNALAAACACLFLLPGARAWAEPITWSYGWSADPGTLNADGGTPAIKFIPGVGDDKTGSKDITAAQLQSLGTAGTTYNFTDKIYTLAMEITDSSNAKGKLLFSGILNGGLGASTGGLTNQFAQPFTKTLDLNGNTYAVTIGSFVAPGAPGSGTLGRIGADVTVSRTDAGGTPPPPVTQVPEPGSLLLAALGLSALGARRVLGRKRTSRTATAA